MKQTSNGFVQVSWHEMVDWSHNHGGVRHVSIRQAHWSTSCPCLYLGAANLLVAVFMLVSPKQFKAVLILGSSVMHIQSLSILI